MPVALVKDNTALFLGVAIAIGLSAIAGCKKEKETAGPVEITYWESWTGFERDALIAVVDKFNSSQGDVRVRMVTVSDMTEKLLVAIAGGCPPDVSMMYGQMLYSYAEKGALTCLDALIEGTEIRKENYHPIYWDLCTFRGKLWGLPTTPAVYALHWNKALFREAGLDAQTPPKTYQQLAEFNRRLIRRDERGHLVQTGFMTGGGDVSEWTGWAWGYWFGGSLWDGRSKMTLDCAGNLEALLWVLSFYREFDTVELSNFLSGCGRFNSPDNPFVAGRVAIVFQGVWMSNFIDKYAPGMEWAAAPFPYVRPDIRNVTVADLDIVAIPKGSKHPKEAFEFIRFMQQTENMELLCGGQKKNSPLAHSTPDFIQKHPHPYLDVFIDLSKSDNVLGIPEMGCWFEVQRDYMHAREQTTELCRRSDVREREAVLRELKAALTEKRALDIEVDELLERARKQFEPSAIPAAIKEARDLLAALDKEKEYAVRTDRLLEEMAALSAVEQLPPEATCALLTEAQDLYFRMMAHYYLADANVKTQRTLDRELRLRRLRHGAGGLARMFPIRTLLLEPAARCF